MPKRSNDFQRLIYLVRLNLADGAKVTESKLLRDRVTKSLREVDVVVEGTVGGQPVRVCIECRDHRRVADVTWVEQMKAKHERLNTNALLLASRSGFTSEALSVAKSYGIDTFTLEEPDEAELKGRFAPRSALWLRTVRITPDKVRVTVGEGDALLPEVVVTSPDNLLHRHDGAELGSLRQLVEILIGSDVPKETLLRDATEEHKFFDIEWRPPIADPAKTLYMRKLDPPMLRVVHKVRISGPCRVEIGRFDLRHGRVNNLEVAWGKAVVDGKDAMAVATKDSSGKHTLSINFKGPAGSASAA
jgi:hypothetical protein